VKITLSKFLG